VCHGFAADEVGLTLDLGEMQKAAEVVILVENVEEHVCFRRAQLKGRQGNGLAETACYGKVTIHNFAKAQHGRTRGVMGWIP